VVFEADYDEIELQKCSYDVISVTSSPFRHQKLSVGTIDWQSIIDGVILYSIISSNIDLFQLFHYRFPTLLQNIGGAARFKKILFREN